MSTKNLARTVIEGGRSRQSGMVRRHSNVSECAWACVTSHERLTASELDDAIYRPPGKVYRDFSGELAVAICPLQES